MDCRTEELILSDPDCVFCRIVDGTAEATFVYDDDDVVVFLTTGPVTSGHLMVVPRVHLPYLADIDGRLGGHMFNVAQRMAQALRASSLQCEVVNLFYADGEAAFQEIFHSHLHVFPRYKGDSFRLDADWDNVPSRAELDRVGEQVRAALAAISET